MVWSWVETKTVMPLWLICSKKTNPDEITSFLYSAIFCDKNILFTNVNSYSGAQL